MTSDRPQLGNPYIESMSLQSNALSHWLSANLESALYTWLIFV